MKLFIGLQPTPDRIKRSVLLIATFFRTNKRSKVTFFRTNIRLFITLFRT